MRKRDTVLEAEIERTNSHKIDILHNQVIEIKKSSQAINDEVMSSTKVLDLVTASFDKGKQNISGVFNRFESILQQKNNRISIYIAGILAILFIIIWKASLSR